MGRINLPSPLDDNKEANMLDIAIDKEGILVHERVLARRFRSIEHGRLDEIRAIVVHQTDAPTAQHTFNGYLAGGNGAHFLIDKNGRIYQTASLYARCYHVGRYIKSKCLTVDKRRCSGKRMAQIMAMSWSAQVKALDAHERGKIYPDRYPINSDSIGIELVGKSTSARTYESVTAPQNFSLSWLIGELHGLFKTSSDDVYRHPDVSYKNPGEAGSAKW
jgi:N-acetyl-anhydromuramyl-L-alanine amidase AmpD